MIETQKMMTERINQDSARETFNVLTTKNIDSSDTFLLQNLLEHLTEHTQCGCDCLLPTHFVLLYARVACIKNPLSLVYIILIGGNESFEVWAPLSR